MIKARMLSRLAFVLVALAAAFAVTTERGAAQQNTACCSYFVDSQIPATCYPVPLTTLWSTGFVGPVMILGNGLTQHNAPPQGMSCPPSAVFFGATLTGMPPFASWNNIQQYTVNGCCLLIRIGFDAAGCTYIYIRPC